MMRILYVLNAMGGGASEGIYESLAKLPRDQFTPFAITPPGSAARRERIQPLFEDIHITPLSWWSTDPSIDPLRRAAQKFGHWRHGAHPKKEVPLIKDLIARWQIDLVHTGTSLTASGALAAQAMRVPHIWHIKETIGQQGRLRFGGMTDAQLVAHIAKLSAQIVVMSDYIGTIFRQQQCNKVTVVPDGVNLAPYQAATNRVLRSELGLDDNTLLVGMVASMTSNWKRHDVFIRMVAQMADHYPNTHFVMLGPVPGAGKRWPHDLPRRYYLELEKLAKELVPPGRLTLFGFYPNPPDIMHSLDVLVHTCDTEPFGRIAIEAQAAGTPVVGPQTGGIAETVADGETGLLVPPGDVAAFAAATGHLLENTALRTRLGQAGQQRAQAHYTIEHYLEKLIAVYNQKICC